MELKDNQYFVDGLNVLDLVNKYDSPLYLYDGNKIVKQYQKLQKAFKQVKNLEIHYACKALNNINILKLLKNQGSGLDTVSIQEVRLGLEAGFNPQEIIYTPNNVDIEEYKKAAELGVKINIDNLSMLEQFGQSHPNYPVCIRINPHIMAGGNSNISVGHIDSKFGISMHQVPHIQRVVENTGLKVEGVHMHTGSDILDIEVFLEGAEILLDIALQFPDLSYVDFGSGFKVAYKPGDPTTDIESLGKLLGKRFNDFCKEYGKDLTLVFEPGKFLVSEAGFFLAKVNVVKHTTSTVFAGVDSGFNHLIRPMFYNSYHEVFNVSYPQGKMRYYTVVGYICETDTFGHNRRIAEVNEGDILCFRNAGAYCFTMASNFNSRYRPAEVLVYKGKDHLIRQRETFEDLLKNQMVVEL
jgi:diaminopimelate decarboxylase